MKFPHIFVFNDKRLSRGNSQHASIYCIVLQQSSSSACQDFVIILFDQWTIIYLALLILERLPWLQPADSVSGQ